MKGGKAAERAADGDARPPWQLHDPRAEPLHPDCGRLRWTLHWRSLSPRRLPRRHRLRHWDPARRHHHIPVLRNLREGAGRDGRHEHSAVLGPRRQWLQYPERKLLVKLQQRILWSVWCESRRRVVLWVTTRVWVMCYLYGRTL